MKNIPNALLSANPSFDWMTTIKKPPELLSLGIRFITILGLYGILVKANIWLTPLSNFLLVFGCRSFLIFSPSVVKTAKGYAVFVSVLIIFLGSLLLCFNKNLSSIIGTLLVGFGISTSGYLIRSRVAETASGAAYNKMTANAGLLLAGLVLSITHFHSRLIFFSLGCILFFIALALAFVDSRQSSPIVLHTSEFKGGRQTAGWSLIGIAVGIKLFGVYSVLPQYLIHTIKYLPDWYSMMVFANAATVILIQLPIMTIMEKVGKSYNAFKLILAILLFGMFMIAFPSLFRVETLLGALIWTTLLTTIECCSSYLDVEGYRSGFLLTKEIMIGAGGGIAVLLVRYFSPPYSNLILGILGALIIVFAVYSQHRNTERKDLHDLAER